MALTNYSKKCTSCGGNKWEYDKARKLWICLYCGAQVERQEQYDGLYTIKNVVRQVILDSANRRMEQADRNLSECQKINARYVGTLIAGICFRLIAAVSGGVAGQDPRTLLGQVRRDYQLLTEESREMSDDETALYEFLDSSDAWAVLATVFDTLGDEQRREYLLTLVDLKQVFSKQTNMSLLRFALKNSRMEFAEQILSNQENIDIRDAFQIVLNSCPDGEQKGSMAAGLLAAGALKAGEEEVLDNYLSSQDSVQTKAALALAACQAGLVLHMEVLLREVLGASELPVLQQILQALFKRRLYDGELELLMSFAAAQRETQRCLAVLDAMVASEQFVALNVRQAQEFVCNNAFTPDARMEILTRLHHFSPADRMWETVAGAYLCQGREPAQNRGVMLEGLCKDINSVPARDFEQYVLQCTLDGQEKPARIRSVLTLSGMNTGFFRELAGKYLQAGKDPAEVRTAVLHQLLECGLLIDGAVLIAYICESAEPSDSKVELVQLALKNGTVLRADALSIYLERCSGEPFSPALFALLYRDASIVTGKAMENYVLYCKDSPAVKTRNAVTLASRTGMRFGSSGCAVRCQGSMLSCSLAQAYILTTADDYTLASSMVRAMTDSGTRLNTDIQIDGRTQRFSKYLAEKRSTLSPVAEQLCQEHRLFSRFF